MPPRAWKLGLVAIFATGCATVKQPTYISYKHHPLLDSESGIIIVADACIRRKELFNNYIVVAESKMVAKTMLKSIEGYLTAHKVRIQKLFVPAVCGFLSTDRNIAQDVADNIGGEINELTGPYGVSDNLTGDPAVIEAFAKVSLNAHIKPWQDTYKKEYKNKEVVDESINLPISKEDFSMASLAISEKLSTPSIMYVSIAGVSGSGGLGAVRFLGNIAVGTLTAMAVGPVVTTGRSNYMIGYSPFPSSSNSMRMSVSLINLVEGNIPWSKRAAERLDPIELDATNVLSLVDRLLSDLVRQESTEWSPPGRPN
ncbi:MAG: hypothetical protein P8179_21645 [Candidatus Thiodiazotropha sp.]